MSDIILHSTDCPKCKILKEKLDTAGILYSINSDIKLMEALGIMSVPILQIGLTMMDFTTAYKWIIGGKND